MARFVSPTESPIIGVKERVYGVALADEFNEKGEPTYAGGTEIDWNSQEQLTRIGPEDYVKHNGYDDSRVYVDDDGDEWHFNELQPAPADVDIPEADQQMFAWRFEVANGETLLGFEDWKKAQAEMIEAVIQSIEKDEK